MIPFPTMRITPPDLDFNPLSSSSHTTAGHRWSAVVGLIMKRFALILFVAVISCLSITKLSFADAVKEGKDINQLTNDADVIVIANVVKSVPQVVSESEKRNDQDFILKDYGVSELEKIQVVKGEISGKFTLTIPPMYFSRYNFVVFDPSDKPLLVFLKKNGVEYSVVDENIPCVPISRAVASQYRMGKNPLADVTRIITDSCEDKGIRPLMCYLLRDSVGLYIKEGLEKFLSGEIDASDDSMLYVLVRNQSSKAIPICIKIAKSEWGKKNGPVCLTALGEFNDLSMSAYINSLLFEESPFIRINSLSFIRKHKLKSSAPYLLVAILDGDPIISFESYRSLIDIYPEIGVPLSYANFVKQKPSEVNRVQQWWTKYLEKTGQEPKD